MTLQLVSFCFLIWIVQCASLEFYNVTNATALPSTLCAIEGPPGGINDYIDPVSNEAYFWVQCFYDLSSEFESIFESLRVDIFNSTTLKQYNEASNKNISTQLPMTISQGPNTTNDGNEYFEYPGSSCKNSFTNDIINCYLFRMKNENYDNGYEYLQCRIFFHKTQSWSKLINASNIYSSNYPSTIAGINWSPNLNHLICFNDSYLIIHTYHTGNVTMKHGRTKNNYSNGIKYSLLDLNGNAKILDEVYMLKEAVLNDTESSIDEYVWADITINSNNYFSIQYLNRSIYYGSSATPQKQYISNVVGYYTTINDSNPMKYYINQTQLPISLNYNEAVYLGNTICVDDILITAYWYGAGDWSLGSLYLVSADFNGSFISSNKMNLYATQNSWIKLIELSMLNDGNGSYFMVLYVIWSEMNNYDVYLGGTVYNLKTDKSLEMIGTYKFSHDVSFPQQFNAYIIAENMLIVWPAPEELHTYAQMWRVEK
eukprot:227448_1